MAFAPHDIDAMLSDFGQQVEFRGRRVGLGTIDTTLTGSGDGAFQEQRKVFVLRVVAGALDGWERGDVVTCGGKRWKVREKIDDARTIDEAYDLFSLGAA
jgi:hypothetical protein